MNKPKNKKDDDCYDAKNYFYETILRKKQRTSEYQKAFLTFLDLFKKLITIFFGNSINILRETLSDQFCKKDMTLTGPSMRNGTHEWTD